MPAAADTMPTVGQLLQEAGYNPAKVKPLGTGVWNDAGVARVPAIQGGWFASPDTAGFNAFAGRYQQRFNSAPTRTAARSSSSASRRPTSTASTPRCCGTACDPCSTRPRPCTSH